MLMLIDAFSEPYVTTVALNDRVFHSLQGSQSPYSSPKLEKYLGSHLSLE